MQFLPVGKMSLRDRQKYNGAYRVDELDACKVHIVLCIFTDQFVIVNRLGLDVLMTLMSIR